MDEDLLSSDCLSILRCMASAYAVDISAIEAKHASTREFTMLRSRGWVPNLEAMGSKFATQRFANAEPPDHGPKQKSDEAAKKRRGGGGPWRAFCSDVSRGQQLRDITSLSLEYAELSEEEMLRYQEAGRAGTLAHRAGHRAFGQPAPRSRNTAAPLPLPGNVLPSGAMVALDVPREQQLLPYTGPTFEDQLQQHKAQLSLSMPKDDMSRAEQDEIQHFCADVPQTMELLSALQEHSRLQGGLSRDTFARSSPGGGPDITGLRWTPPTARLVEALQGI